MTTHHQQTERDGLSKRSVEILRLLAEGLSDREIADRLVMTVNTIKWYNRQIYSILDVSSRTQAIARAHELHLLDEHEPAAPVAAAPPKTNLPVEVTQFIGRVQEMGVITRLLHTAHLLTLIGAPGTGKTRLAIQAARQIANRFPDGVYFVPLAPISDPALVTNALAAALGITQLQDQLLIETLKADLSARHVLLILDNFEHVLPAAAQVAELLAAAPHLRVIVTSREPLHLYGEQEFVVPPLALPDPDSIDPAALAQYESTALFMQRAQAVQAGFEATAENAADIARICQQLEGLPLAIELAAARIKLLPPRALLNRLSSRLDTLTGGALDLPTRQQTLRNTIAWSYNLLDDGEKRLFTRLAVFAGGWSLEAAEQICAADLPMLLLDGLESLMDKSLIQPCSDANTEARFLMLETIREYALEQLRASGQEESLRARHAAYFIDFAEQTGHALYSRYRAAWFTHLETEQNNFRAVLGWSLAGDPEPGLRLIAALGVCWRIRSYLVEGFNWAVQLLAKPVTVPLSVRADALSSTSRLLACYIGNTADADHMSREALELAHSSGNTRSLAWALHARGAHLMGSDVVAARACFLEALPLFQALGDQLHIGQLLNNLGEVSRIEGDVVSAERWYLQAHFLLKQIGNPWGANVVLLNLASLAHHHADEERARALYTESLATSQEIGDSVSIVTGLTGLAAVRATCGEAKSAVQLLGAAERLRESIGVPLQGAEEQDYRAALAAARRHLAPADFAAAWATGRRLSVDAALP
jgi:non-specific serine/threonine protein kinase